MKKQIYCIVILVLIATFTFTACEETSGSTTLRLRLTTKKQISRVISPEGQGLSITGYTVSGNGPNGKTFSVSTHSTQVDITGLVIGAWEIEVKGYNQQGTLIAEGSASHHLTTKNNVVEVVLSDLAGTGTVNIGFSWGDPAYSNITFELKLKPQGEEETTITEGKTVYPSTASARYQATLPTGSYDLSFTLYSDGTKVAGGVEALRILQGCATEGEITIIVDKETPEATGLLISSNIVEPVEGVIQGVEATVLPNTPITATFTKTRGGGPKSVTIDWYLDGTHIASGNSLQFSTYTGAHRLDVVAQTELLGSVGSESKSFRASVESLQGTPFSVLAINDGDYDTNEQEYWLTGVTDIAFMRDGRLFIASSKGLQLCEIKQDSLLVINNFSSTSPETSPLIDRYPTNGITDIVVDTIDDIVCTTARNLGTVVVYKYNASVADLEKIAVFDTTSNLWGSSITNVDLDTGLNTLYVADSIANRLYYSTYTSESVGDFTSNKLFHLDYDVINPTYLTVSSDGQRIAITCPTNNTFHTYKVTRSATLDPIIFPETNNIMAESSAGGPYMAKIVGNLLQVVMEDGIHLYSPPVSGKYWIYEHKLSDDNSPVQNVCYDSSYSKGWVIHGGSQPHVAKVSLYNGCPTYDSGITATGIYQPTDIAYSPKGNFLSISGNDQLRLLRISDN
ncbi:MAG: hypothetical protein WCS59_05285 [Sphaerochaetaceae bacterium]|jgi:hypothetical protein|nr:hypothetical protein [Sphaerochaetaceae bacterium]MDD4218602.1 hypothetical protein [Sphaerochaetaceae bacterium]MDY0371415.1 hypothetical protein [Sphaerochaetaceae bacterium]